MALPAELLEKLPRGVALPQAVGRGEVLATGLGQLDAALPGGGLLRGAVVELAISGGAGLGTQLGLAACREVQREALRHGGELPWCAFVDPSATLHAPGVREAGVELERLLVVRPNPEAVTRVAVRLAESRAFAVLIVDTLGVPGIALKFHAAAWARSVRRMALAIEGSAIVTLLLTEHRPVGATPLPVAQRIVLSRPTVDTVKLVVVKDRHGRIAAPRTVAWREPFEGKALHAARERSTVEAPQLERLVR
ncbi:MAG: recombinase A [Polyangiaceae bacterium]